MGSESDGPIPGPDLIKDPVTLKQYGAKAGLFIETIHDSHSLRWAAAHDGAYGTITWDATISEWRIRARLQEERPDRIPSLFRDIKRPTSDASQLLLLVSMMEAGQLEPHRDGLLFEDLQTARKTGAADRFSGSIPDSQPERGFVLMLKKWVAIYRTQHDCSPLTELIPEVQVVEAGGALPFQAFGAWDSHPFYFRYRHSSASLSVGGEDPVLAPLWSARADYGEPFSGFLDLDEFMYLFAYLGERLTAAPQPYQVTIEYPGIGPTDVRPVYGDTRAVAMDRAREIARMAHPDQDAIITLSDPPVSKEEIPPPPAVPNYSALRPANLKAEPVEESPDFWA